MKAKDAIKHINKEGILLVYPIHNKIEPKSLWSEFYPKSKMKWEWDTGGDDRVASLWHLREELSRSDKVLYVKWYQGRATFFSKEIFTAMLRLLNQEAKFFSEDARRILEVLELNSPSSTKELKKICEMSGKANERRFEKALKELWQRLQIVGYGEKDDGAFPSLCVGATKVIFENVWNEAVGLSEKDAWKRLAQFANDSLIYKFVTKVKLQQSTSVEKKSKRVSIIRGIDIIK